jgi:hypothetical protein
VKDRRAVARVVPGLVLVVAVVAVVVVSGGSGGAQRPSLRIEAVNSPETGEPELLVAVRGKAGRDASFATAPGGVGIACVDRAGRTTVTGRHAWPFTGDPGLELPHVHQPASAAQVAATVRCRLIGTREPIEGYVE